MTNRDRAAIDIRLCAVKPQFLLHGKILRGKCFIDLNTIEIGKAQVCAFESQANSGCRTYAHDLGRYTDHAPRDKASHRLQPMLSHSLACSEHHTGSSIVDTTGITRCDHAALAETSGQLSQGLH